VMVERSRLMMGRRTVMMVARSVLFAFLHRSLFKKVDPPRRPSKMPNLFRCGVCESQRTALVPANLQRIAIQRHPTAEVQSTYRRRHGTARLHIAPAPCACMANGGGGFEGVVRRFRRLAQIGPKSAPICVIWCVRRSLTSLVS
jgi:hypothetical protein